MNDIAATLPKHDSFGGDLTLSDTTQGQDAELFRGAVEADTLEKFENPPELPEPPKQADPPKPQEEQKPEAQQTEGPVPAGRLREEAEARRRAEREVSDLRARLAAYEVQPRQQQQAPKLDVLDNPSGFVKQEVDPLITQIRQELQMTREAMSMDSAVRLYGEERVGAARAALEQSMARHDPAAWATYNRAMSSHDPYGVITRWHVDRETLQAVGSNLEDYNKRILDNAMKDPEFQKRVIEAARGSAQAAGRQVHQPVTTNKAPVLPSLSDMGAAGGDEQLQDLSDRELFRAAVTAKRR